MTRTQVPSSGCPRRSREHPELLLGPGAGDPGSRAERVRGWGRRPPGADAAASRPARGQTRQRLVNAGTRVRTAARQAGQERARRQQRGREIARRPTTGVRSAWCPATRTAWAQGGGRRCAQSRGACGVRGDSNSGRLFGIRPHIRHRPTGPGSANRFVFGPPIWDRAAFRDRDAFPRPGRLPARDRLPGIAQPLCDRAALSGIGPPIQVRVAGSGSARRFGFGSPVRVRVAWLLLRDFGAPVLDRLASSCPGRRIRSLAALSRTGLPVRDRVA